MQYKRKVMVSQSPSTHKIIFYSDYKSITNISDINLNTEPEHWLRATTALACLVRAGALAGRGEI